MGGGFCPKNKRHRMILVSGVPLTCFFIQGPPISKAALHRVILLNMYLSSTCIFTCHCLLIRLNWSICSFMHSTALASDWSMMHCSISIWHWIRISCSFL